MLKTRLVSAVGRALQPFFPRRSLPARPKAIIVLKPCCLGDVVLATPALAALNHRFPQADIDVAVGRWSRAVLADNPRVRNLLDSGRVGQGRYTWRDVWRVAHQLRQKKYDLAVTLDRSPVVGLIPWLAGIPHRAGLNSLHRGFAHTVRVPVPTAARHEAQIYLDCVTADMASMDAVPSFWTEFYPPPAATEKISAWANTPFVILHPAGGVNPGMRMPDKRWPAERFSALADRLANAGWRVLFSGTADDVPLCRQIVAKMESNAEIVAGKLSLGEFGALCRRAALFVGGDTGAMHVAVASGCPTVAIFGPTDPRRYGPFAPPSQAKVVWTPWNIPEGGVGQANAQSFSWDNGASVADVWAACTDLLAEQPSSPRKEQV